MSSGSRAGLVRIAAPIGVVMLVAMALSTDSTKVQLPDERVYWTRSNLEPDTLACIWLLKRYIRPDCEIRYLPRDEESVVGIPFDMPLVDYSRTRTKSTFHVMREQNNISDPRVATLEKLIDEIEVGGWNAELSDGAKRLESLLRGCVRPGVDPHFSAQCGIDELDKLVNW